MKSRWKYFQSHKSVDQVAGGVDGFQYLTFHPPYHALHRCCTVSEGNLDGRDKVRVATDSWELGGKLPEICVE